MSSASLLVSLREKPQFHDMCPPSQIAKQETGSPAGTKDNSDVDKHHGEKYHVTNVRMNQE